MKHKIVALVGMPGSGKSVVGSFFVAKGYQLLRFGQITLDEAIRRGSVNEETEKEIRNGFRKRYGMGAYAILNLAKLKKLYKQGDVLIDDLYSWEEYKILKEKYKKDFFVIAVVACPKIRYERLTKRKYDPKKDKKAVFRPLTKLEAQSRDYDQIENAAQGGPIAMADFFVINEGSKIELKKKITTILGKMGSGDN